MSNLIISRTRQEVLLDLPALTSLGEEFNLKGPRFESNTVGKVIQVLGQSAGHTRIRLSVYKGSIKPPSQVKVDHQMNEKVEDIGIIEHEIEMDPIGDIPDTYKQESNWIGMDNDPRPRSGSENQITEIQKTQHNTFPEDDGSIVMIKNTITSSTDNAIRSPSEAISKVIGLTTGKSLAPVEKVIISQEEHIKALGGQMDNRVGVPGGKRIRRI